MSFKQYKKTINCNMYSSKLSVSWNVEVAKTYIFCLDRIAL
jgi:hypothetical protein